MPRATGRHQTTSLILRRLGRNFAWLATIQNTCMSSLHEFWLMVWGTVATIGFIIVIIGVTIEGVEHFKKFPRKDNARKHQIEKLGWFLVVAGLAMEFLGDHAAKRITDQEGARLNKEAADARLETAKLEQQIIETSNNVVRVDPLNQPITSVTATVMLLQGGTNRSLVIEPLLGSQHIPIIKLLVGASAELKDGWPVELFCTSCERSVATDNLGNPLVNAWNLEFGFGGLSQMMNLNSVPQIASVKEAKKWDTVELDAFIIPKNSDIIGGEVTIIVNSTRLNFAIPPQKTVSSTQDWMKWMQKGNSAMSHPSSNSVTVVSW